MELFKDALIFQQLYAFNRERRKAMHSFKMNVYLGTLNQLMVCKFATAMLQLATGFEE